MYGLFLLFLILVFPALEIYTLFALGPSIGWWLLLWLIASTVAGIWLIKLERMAVFGRLIASLQSGKSPVSALLASGRVLAAGLLLLFPGVISDVMALIILLLPGGTWPRRAPPPRSDVIEGEWARVDAERIERTDERRR